MRVCPKKQLLVPKKIATPTKYRGVGEVEVVVEERRGGQTKTVSIYKHSGKYKNTVSIYKQ